MRHKLTIQIVHHPIELQRLTVIKIPYRQQTLQMLRQQFVPEQDVRIAVNGVEVTGYPPIPADATVLFAPAAAKPMALAAAWEAGFGAFAYAVAFNIALSFGLSYLGGLLFGPDMSSPREAITGTAFGWNPQTTQQEGIPKGISWGTNMHYGNIIARWTDVVDDNEILYTILDYGGGPIQGRGANPLFINGRVSGDYSGVTLQDRLGTLNQTCMTGFEKTKLEYGLGWPVVHDDGPVTFTTPNKFFDDIEFTLCFPKGLWMFHKDGDFEGLPTNVKVEVQEVPAGGWTTVYDETPGGGVMKAIYKAFSVNTLVPGTVVYGKQYDVRVTKVSGDLDHRKACNVTQLRSVREIVDTAFTYPGRALVGISALAAEDLSQQLNTKWIADGKLVNVYNGTTWSIEFSKNRAWVVFDELTQPVISGSDPYVIERYEGIDPNMLDAAFFYEWAEWCADDVTDGHGGTEKRMTCNHILDYESNVWDVAHELSQVGRCSLYWQGNVLTGWVDKAVAAADYVDLVTFDNIMTRSWKSAWAGYGERAGNVEVFFRDALQGYERKGLPRSNEDSGLYTRIITVEGTGVTGHALAARVANHALQRNKLIKNYNTVRMYKDALRYRLGQVVRLQSKVPNWGDHYRVIKSEASNTVELDRVVEAAAGDIIFVRSYDETNKKVVIKSYTVESISGRVAHWKLDDNLPTTVVLDAIGDHTGILQGGDNTEDKNITGKVDDAFNFNGSDDYVDTGDPFQDMLRGSFSISMWIKPDDGRPATNELFIGARDSIGDDSNVYIQLDTTGIIRFDYQSEGNRGAIADTDDPVFADGVGDWTHIVVVADSTIGGAGGKKIYVNGVKVDLDSSYNGNTAGVDFSEYTTARNIIIGAYRDASVIAFFFAGGMDNVQLFNRALTAEDVTTVFNEGNVGKEVTIVETWDPTPVKNNIVAIGVAGAIKTRRIIKMSQSAQNYFDVEFETYDASLFDSDAIDPNFNNPDYVFTQPAAALVQPITRPEVLAMIGELLQFQPDTDIPHTSNCTWSGDDVDTVSWAKTDAGEDIHFRYKGTSYAITPDSTTDEFIYWDPAFTTIFKTTNSAAVALAPGMWLMCTNKDGVAHPANAIQLQHAGILLAGTIRAEHYLELRNTYVYNAEDSLDSSKPFEVRFKIVSEMIAIVSVKLSFSLMPYRAYSTAAVSDGGQTSSGGSTWPWGRTGSEDPGNTNAASAGNTTSVDPGDTYTEDGANSYTEYTSNGNHRHGIWGTSHSHTMPSHNHSMYGTHVHTMPSHDHLINAPDHTHTVVDHTHDITYGLHEESNSPTVHYHINNGAGFGDPSGNFNSDQTDIAITGSITGTGWKAIRFDTDLRCRVAAIIECKLDINA